MNHSVVFAPEAVAAQLDLYDYIIGHGGADRALGNIERIGAACSDLTAFPERELRWDDLRPGLRVLGFERRVVITFSVASQTITIPGIFCGGCDVDAAYSDAGL